ncbi:MAG: hypothetical protein M5U12_16220 [Verrucomicrobia bacterium]|nr:hypothetical protein [Verrucomicrobiota bacterium]
MIHIPEAARGQPLSDYSLSARLAHAFEGKDCNGWATCTADRFVRSPSFGTAAG